MTHSLHRLGTENSLKGDYVFLCTPAKGINDKDSTLKLIRILEILLEVGPTNIGFYGHGSLMDDIPIETIKKSIHDTSRLRCCFHEREKLEEVLRIIKNEDLGLSITVSGLLSELKDICEELTSNRIQLISPAAFSAELIVFPDERSWKSLLCVAMG